MSKIKIFLGQPCYGAIELEAVDAIDKALDDDGRYEITAMRLSSSLLAHCFNSLLATCLDAGGFDYFVLLHADVAPSDNWLGVMIQELTAHDLDVIHAPCALKNGKGLTSTAIAWTPNRWWPVRRITCRELQRLPETFTTEALRAEFDPNTYALLPNTGCLLLKIGPWVDEFPGFTIDDRLVKVPAPGGDSNRPRWQAQVMSEDWNFGFWCAEHGVRVGATRKVATRHVGRVPFLTDVAWGSEESDETFFDLMKAHARVA